MFFANWFASPKELLFPLFKQDGYVPPANVNYFNLVLGFILVEQSFEFYLNFRQRKCLRKDSLPDDLVRQVKAIDDSVKEKEDSDFGTGSEDENAKKGKPESMLAKLQEKFMKSQAYNLETNSFSFVSMVYGLCTSLSVLFSGLSVYFWVRSKEFTGNTLGLDSDNEIIVGSIFFLVQTLFDTLIGLPLSLYNTFVVEARHGFNKVTLRLFFTDLLKGLLINAAISIPIMAALVKLIRWGGEQFWIYCWALMFIVSIVMQTIYPNYIMPLFNKFSALPDGKLRDGIEELASSLDFPLTKIFEVDGSKRSSHSNAYLYGFFKDKRIVIYDTLIKNQDDPSLECTNEEVCGILAHELGHWKLSHTLKGFVLNNLLILGAFKGFDYFIYDSDMYTSFGFSASGMPIIVGLSLFSYIMSPAAAVLNLAFNSLTRTFEFEADAFAVGLGKTAALKSGLCKISISNLASFNVDPLYQTFHHSHPSIVERLHAMDVHEEELARELKKQE